MAISAAHFAILKELHKRGVLPQGGSILEIGQANVYGDFDPQRIYDLIEPGLPVACKDPYEQADMLYMALFNDEEKISIDLGGPDAIKADLNLAQEIWNGWERQQFDTVYNHGTAEHVFNIGQVFRTMHDCCKVGGIMLHESPFTGWIDHGFYCLQPTLFWDVAEANGYKIEFVALENLAERSWKEIQTREEILQMRAANCLPDNLMLFVVFRKETDEPFKVPMQGVYAGKVSQEATRAWRQLR